jgi:hypothetical protein
MAPQLLTPLPVSTDYKSDNYTVNSCLYADQTDVVVCFDGWRPSRTENYSAFGFEFLRQRGVSAIEILPHRNDWYQSDDAVVAMGRIRNLCGTRRKIGYGSSMGGYAASNFSNILELSRAIAYSPQSSVDPLKMPLERRWGDDVLQIRSFMHDLIDEPKSCTLMVLFDPLEPMDKLHANKLIAIHAASDAIILPFAGHNTAQFFADLGILQELTIPMLFGSTSVGEVRRIVRKKRRLVGAYWARLSLNALERGRLERAHEYATLGFKYKSDGLYEEYHRYAETLYFLGEESRAIDLWRNVLDDPRRRTGFDYLIRQSAYRWKWDRIYDQLELER